MAGKGGRQAGSQVGSQEDSKVVMCREAAAAGSALFVFVGGEGGGEEAKMPWHRPVESQSFTELVSQNEGAHAEQRADALRRRRLLLHLLGGRTARSRGDGIGEGHRNRLLDPAI